MSLRDINYDNCFLNMSRIFITEQNTVFINKFNACGFCYEFVMKNETDMFMNYCLKDILNMKVSMGIKELYVEINNGEMNKIIRVEDEVKIINESELNISPFAKKIIYKLSIRERDVKVKDLLSYLKVNDIKKAFQLIQFVKMKNILTYGDVCNLYHLYIKHLEIIKPRFINNNLFYLKRLVLGLISVNKINIIF
ncbi:hypothetical protein EKH82_05920 [Pantoea dispersa]|nr:hypothetical protein EKH82_05920 [Pantoea dispersa]